MRTVAPWAMNLFLVLAATGCGESPPSQAKPAAPAASNQTTRSGRPQFTVRRDTIPILRTVLKPSRHYTIDDQVKVDGYFYKFMVHSELGDQEVTSVRELIKYCHEINVITEYKRTYKGSHFWDGMKQSAKGVGKGFGDLVVHPGQSLKRVGQGTGRFFRALGSPFRRKAPTIASDGTNRALLGSGPGGGERRLLASELGLDVYTNNPQAQAFIKEVAGARMMGKLPIGSAVFAMPGGIVFTLSLTPMGFDPTTEELIRNNSPAELKRVLGLRYQEHFGLDYLKAGATRNLLENPNFSPREQAYILRYLLDMKGVGRLHYALDFLGHVNSPAYARIVVAQLEMLALVHKRGRPFARFVPVRNTLGALAVDGTLCFLISIDTVRYWSDVRTSIQAAVSAAQAEKARYVEIWSTGDIDAQSVALAKRYGVAVRQNILENPLFRRPREGVPPAPRPTERRVADRSAPAPELTPTPTAEHDPRRPVNPLTGEPSERAYAPIPSPNPVHLQPEPGATQAKPPTKPTPPPPPTPQPPPDRKRRVEEALPQLY